MSLVKMPDSLGRMMVVTSKLANMYQSQMDNHKRCVFCRKILREDDFCQNEDCPDYKRTQINDEQN